MNSDISLSVLYINHRNDPNVPNDSLCKGYHCIVLHKCFFSILQDRTIKFYGVRAIHLVYNLTISNHLSVSK